MKLKFHCLLLLFVATCTMSSCSNDSDENPTLESTPEMIQNYSYSSIELETMKLINDYRLSLGLNTLQEIDHVSFKSEEHDNYMITNNVVNHDDFISRSENIIKVLGAQRVSENIAYNYATPQAALDAWLKSESHQINIAGDFTHFGISIRENPVNGRKYYTNIFVKI